MITKQSCGLVQKWLVLPLPTPISFCEGPEQAAQPSCRPTSYPVMIIREPVTPNQVCGMLDSSCEQCAGHAAGRFTLARAWPRVCKPAQQLMFKLHGSFNKLKQAISSVLRLHTAEDMHFPPKPMPAANAKLAHGSLMVPLIVQATLCTAALDDSSEAGSITAASGAAEAPAPQDTIRHDAVTMHECHPSHAGQIWQVGITCTNCWFAKQ